MSKGWNYIPGDWWVQCDVCGKKVRASKIKKRWDGFLVCSSDYETRHPQDFVRARQDKISVPFSRPDSQEVFTTVSYITLYVADGYVANDYVQEEYP